MKKLLFIILLVVGSMNAMMPPQGGYRRMTQQQLDFNSIMQRSWASHPVMMQQLVDRSWDAWSDQQRMLILQHMANQGLLSQEEVDNWPMDQIPQKSYGG